TGSRRLRKRLGAAARPRGEGDTFRGLVDLVSMKAYLCEKDGPAKEAPTPPEIEAEAQKARNALVDAAAEADDSLLEKFLGGEELSAEELGLGVRGGSLKKSIVPGPPVAAYRVMGIGRVLDALSWI